MEPQNPSGDTCASGHPRDLSHLEVLESEAVHVFREVAGEFERPVLLFSG
ncbi:sulfate adenylyltransferase small subunit, partial [Streptomyces roseifaciens]